MKILDTASYPPGSGLTPATTSPIRKRLRTAAFDNVQSKVFYRYGFVKLLELRNPGLNIVTYRDPSFPTIYALATRSVLVPTPGTICWGDQVVPLKWVYQIRWSPSITFHVM